MTTTRAPKSGPTKVTHRGCVFTHEGETYQTIDNGPSKSTIWAINMTTGAAQCFSIRKGELYHPVPRPMVVPVRRTYQYPDELGYVPFKLCTAADFR